MEWKVFSLLTVLAKHHGPHYLLVGSPASISAALCYHQTSGVTLTVVWGVPLEQSEHLDWKAQIPLSSSPPIGLKDTPVSLEFAILLKK